MTKILASHYENFQVSGLLASILQIRAGIPRVSEDFLGGSSHLDRLRITPL